MRIETAFPQLYTMDQFSSCNSYLLSVAKLTFWAGIIKQLFGQLLARYLIYLARENRYWALPCQTNQISDSSRPNNCKIYLQLIQMQQEAPRSIMGRRTTGLKSARPLCCHFIRMSTTRLGKKFAFQYPVSELLDY